jgi:hypothetical protein
MLCFAVDSAETGGGGSEETIDSILEKEAALDASAAEAGAQGKQTQTPQAQTLVAWTAKKSKLIWRGSANGFLSGAYATG